MNDHSFPDHDEIEGVCSDQCDTEEDGTRWHGASWRLGPDYADMHVKAHEDGTVEILSVFWLQSPTQDELAATVQKLVLTMAESIEIDPDTVAPMNSWVTVAYEKGVIQ